MNNMLISIIVGIILTMLIIVINNINDNKKDDSKDKFIAILMIGPMLFFIIAFITNLILELV